MESRYLRHYSDVFAIHTKLEGKAWTKVIFLCTSRHPFFMDSKNSGVAPTGHIQTFD